MNEAAVRNNRIQCLCALISASIVAVCVCVGVTMNLTTVYDENFDHMGIRTFCMFTVNSNILCAASCAFSLIQTLRGRSFENKAAMLFRYAGTAAVTVTMMTVLLFLGPLYGYASMFSRWNLWLHLLGPLLAVVSFVWLERDGTFPEKKQLPLSMLPVIAYGIVYLVMVVVLGKDKGGWPDFYGFNGRGKWYLSYVCMLAGTALIGLVLRKLRCVQKNRE